MFRSVSGPVAPGVLLTSPLTGQECVWFRVRVESWQARKDLHHRETVYLARSEEPFLVGEMLVSTHLIDLAPQVEETVTTTRPPTRQEAPLLHELADRGLISVKALNRRAHLLDDLVWQTSETILVPGQRVRARGRVGRYQGAPILRRSIVGSSFQSI